LYTADLNNELLRLIIMLKNNNIYFKPIIYDFKITAIKTKNMLIRLELVKTYLDELLVDDGIGTNDRITTPLTMASHFCELKKINFNVKLGDEFDLYLRSVYRGGRVEVLNPSLPPKISLDFNLFYLNLMGGDFPHGNAS